MAAQTPKGNLPVVVLKDDASQVKGREAQKNNIAAAKIIADIVHTSLGPKGMDKMLVDSLGDVTITNDGATILKEIDVQHPAAKMLVEISKTTDNEVGDGTTSAVVLAGALLEHAEELVLQDVHPTIIVDGYRKAGKKAREFLDQIADKVSPTDNSILLKIAKTSMQTKLVRKDYIQEEGARIEFHFEKSRSLLGEEVKPFEARLESKTNKEGLKLLNWTWKSLKDSTFESVCRLANEGLDNWEIAQDLDIHKSTVSRYVQSGKGNGTIKPCNS